MSSQSLILGSPILMGDNTTPGVRIPDNILAKIPEIDRVCKEFGLNYPPFVVEFLTYDEISEVAAYGGFPIRYPHWRWGMEYEELARGYQYGRHRIYEMVVNCVDPKTSIVTKRGSIPASEVCAGDTVFSNNGSRRVAKVQTQQKSEVFTIKLKNQVRSLTCTPNHRWSVLRTDGPIWVYAKDIVPGDILIGGDTYHYFKNIPASFTWSPDEVFAKTHPNVRNRLKPLSNPRQMTLPLAELLGAIVGDGSQGVKSRENHVSVVVGNDYPEYLTHVIGLFNTVFQEELILENKQSVTVATLCSKLAVDFIDYIGLPKGCTYKDKRIPWSIWASSNEYRAAFIRGLFDTDGYAGDSLGMSCYNGDLAADVQLMLSEMGIQSSVDHVVNDHNDIWTLTITSRESKFKYRDRIGFATRHKEEGLNRLTDTANCTGGGIKSEYLCRRIVEIGEKCGITTYNERSLGYRINSCRKDLVGVNAIYGLILNAFESGYKEFGELYPIVSNPLYEVESIESANPIETVDIALFDDSHDFLANGVLSHNTNPLYIYCLDSNPEIDHVTVIAHAIGHGDFFQENIFFGPTCKNMMNELATHGTRIERYEKRWGKEIVSEFIDKVLAVDDLLDPAKAWAKRTYQEPVTSDSRTYKFPHRFRTEEGHDYMNPWLNDATWIKKQQTKIREDEVKTALGIETNKANKIRDIMGYLKDHAPLTIWQRDIMAMLYEEAMYFIPQRYTKTINEGWASYVDYNIMALQGMAGPEGIVDYAKHKAGVLGGKYSMNPYALGFKLLMEIEDRWNKGKFGQEYEDCKDMRAKAEWDKKLGLGKQKVFEVRKFYNDYLLISEFFDQEFCEKYEFFEWKLFPNGEYKIASRDWKKIKANLLARYCNGGAPDIRLTDANHRGKGIFLMEHQWDGRGLHPRETADTLRSIYSLWRRPCAVATRDEDNPDQEIVAVCNGTGKDAVESMTRQEFEKKVY